MFQTTYSRDSLGRISSLYETIGGVSKEMDYSYDSVGRLTEVWRNDTLVSQYVYDANGNRIAHITPTQIDSGTYDAQDRMLIYDGTQYFYGRNGDLETKIAGTDTTKYVYDALGNLMAVSLPTGDRIDYIVDGQNRRIAKKFDGQIVKRWVYSGQLSPVAELDSAGNVVAQFVGDYIVKGGNTYRIITDHLGSVRLVLDVNSGSVAERIDYDEFGNVTYDSNPDFQPFGFAGGLYDTETKLVRFGARDYDAGTGRWTNKDPIGFGGGVSNLYEYVVNDPINSLDYNGLQPIYNAWLGTLVHWYVLHELQSRLGPGASVYPSIPGAGPNGGYGYPDLTVESPSGGIEVYELKSAQTLQRNPDAAENQLNSYCGNGGLTRGTSLAGNPSLNAPVKLGPFEADVSYYAPGVLQYQINYNGPKLSAKETYEAIEAFAAGLGIGSALYYLPELILAF